MAWFVKLGMYACGLAAAQITRYSTKSAFLFPFPKQLKQALRPFLHSRYSYFANQQGSHVFRPFLHSRYFYFLISCHISRIRVTSAEVFPFLMRHCTILTPHQQLLRHNHWRHYSRCVTVTIYCTTKNKLHITLFASQTVLLLNLVTRLHDSCQNLYSALFFSLFEVFRRDLNPHLYFAD